MARTPLRWDVESWMADPAVRSVSPAARGLWFDLLCFAHRSRPRGYLINSEGRGLSLQDIGRVGGIRSDVARGLMEELESAGVYSRNESGVIFNRRMAAESTAAGKSTGNPSLESGAKEIQLRPPAALLDWVEWWNGLAGRNLVPHGVDRIRPSIAICRAWCRVQDNSEIRGLLSRRNDIESQIIAADFCRLKWFRFEKLLGAKNKSGEFITRILLDGGYANDRKAEASATEKAMNGMLGIQAWQAVRNVLKRWYRHDKEQCELALSECPETVRVVAETIGWSQLQDGKPDVVRGQFLRLWKDVADVWCENWGAEQLRIEAAQRAAALEHEPLRLEAG